MASLVAELNAKRCQLVWAQEPEKKKKKSQPNAMAEISSSQSGEGLQRLLMSVREAVSSLPLRPLALRQKPMLNVETHLLRNTEGRQIRISQ